MEEALYSMLINDEKLIDLLGSKDNIYPIFADELKGNIIEYEYRDIKNDLVNTSNLSLNLVGEDYDTLLEIKQELYKLLLCKQKTDYRIYKNYKYNSMLSGSSTPLYRDDKKIFLININFLIKWRAFNEEERI